jgi:peptide methionine sulfoxide reductase msrA/msrB
MTFFLISVLAGVLTVLAPCILPLLPVVIGASEPGARHFSRRSVVVILSLAVSVMVFTLLLKASTLLITIPPSVWTWFSGGVLALLGVSLLAPTWWGRLPLVGKLSRVSNQAVGGGYQANSWRGDALMGVALGPVFSTCSPTYLFIIATVLPASLLAGLWYLGGFVLGLTFVLLLIAYFGQQFVNALLSRLTTAARVRQGLGLLLVCVGVAVVLGWDKQLESYILDSGYGATIQFEEELIRKFAPGQAMSEPTSVSVSATTTSSEQVLDDMKTAASISPTGVVSDENQMTELTTEASVTAVEPGSVLAPVAPLAKTATAVFGNGCFWCVEHDLAKVAGVIDVVSGYAGGMTENPDYQNYDAGGHREVVLVTYDPAVVTYANLVEHIIKHGNPTDAGGSFKDRGASYAPALYYATQAEQESARAVVAAVDAAGVFPAPLPLPILPRPTFYPAEEYHQDYAEKNPLRYNFYRSASGRTAFIEKTWGSDLKQFTYSKKNVLSTTKSMEPTSSTQFTPSSWNDYVRPSDEVLRAQLSAEVYRVTREDVTERARTSPLDTNYEPGIYVDVVSGEPLFSSRDKFDSGTGWPSFVRPLSAEVVTLHEDRKLFSVRTEVRSRFADSHLGHVFDDGPADSGGKRYCMNGAALRFVPKAELAAQGYTYWLSEVE